MSDKAGCVAPRRSAKSTFTVTANPPPVANSSHPVLNCGSTAKCLNDQKVHLSLRAYPVVVRQAGDQVNWYFKITNLTSKTIVGPIDFFISGSEGAFASIEDLPAYGFYDLLVEDTVDEEDITRRFIVATVWARLRASDCLIGNVVESEVAVELVQESDGSLEFANPTLLITATETTLDVQVGIDIINLSVLAVDSVILDLSVIFGKETTLSYLIDGQPSSIFNVVNGVLSLVDGHTIAANQRISLLVTNTDKSINLDGLCDQSCDSTVSWRFVGRSTNNSTLAWVGATPAPPTVGSGFSAVKLETLSPTPIVNGTFQGWASTPRDSNPAYEGTFNDGEFDEVNGVYTVPISGRYILAANVNTAYDYALETLSGNDLLSITVDDNKVTLLSLAALFVLRFTPAGVITGVEAGGVVNASLYRVIHLNAGAKIALKANLEGNAQYQSTNGIGTTFSAIYLGA